MIFLFLSLFTLTPLIASEQSIPATVNNGHLFLSEIPDIGQVGLNLYNHPAGEERIKNWNEFLKEKTYFAALKNPGTGKIFFARTNQDGSLISTNINPELRVSCFTYEPGPSKDSKPTIFLTKSKKDLHQSVENSQHSFSALADPYYPQRPHHPAPTHKYYHQQPFLPAPYAAPQYPYYPPYYQPPVLPNPYIVTAETQTLIATLQATVAQLQQTVSELQTKVIQPVQKEIMPPHPIVEQQPTIAIAPIKEQTPIEEPQQPTKTPVTSKPKEVMPLDPIVEQQPTIAIAPIKEQTSIEEPQQPTKTPVTSEPGTSSVQSVKNKGKKNYKFVIVKKAPEVRVIIPTPEEKPTASLLTPEAFPALPKAPSITPPSTPKKALQPLLLQSTPSPTASCKKTEVVQPIVPAPTLPKPAAQVSIPKTVTPPIVVSETIKQEPAHLAPVTTLSRNQKRKEAKNKQVVTLETISKTENAADTLRKVLEQRRTEQEAAEAQEAVQRRLKEEKKQAKAIAKAAQKRETLAAQAVTSQPATAPTTPQLSEKEKSNNLGAGWQFLKADDYEQALVWLERSDTEAVDYATGMAELYCKQPSLFNDALIENVHQKILHHIQHNTFEKRHLVIAYEFLSLVEPQLREEHLESATLQGNLRTTLQFFLTRLQRNECSNSLSLCLHEQARNLLDSSEVQQKIELYPATYQLAQLLAFQDSHCPSANKLFTNVDQRLAFARNSLKTAQEKNINKAVLDELEQNLARKIMSLVKTDTPHIPVIYPFNALSEENLTELADYLLNNDYEKIYSFVIDHLDDKGCKENPVFLHAFTRVYFSKPELIPKKKCFYFANLIKNYLSNHPFPEESKTDFLVIIYGTLNRFVAEHETNEKIKLRYYKAGADLNEPITTAIYLYKRLEAQKTICSERNCFHQKLQWFVKKLEECDSENPEFKKLFLMPEMYFNAYSWYLRPLLCPVVQKAQSRTIAARIEKTEKLLTIAEKNLPQEQFQMLKNVVEPFLVKSKESLQRAKNLFCQDSEKSAAPSSDNPAQTTESEKKPHHEQIKIPEAAQEIETTIVLPHEQFEKTRTFITTFSNPELLFGIKDEIAFAQLASQLLKILKIYSNGSINPTFIKPVRERLHPLISDLFLLPQVTPALIMKVLVKNEPSMFDAFFLLRLVHQKVVHLEPHISAQYTHCLSALAYFYEENARDMAGVIITASKEEDPTKKIAQYKEILKYSLEQQNRFSAEFPKGVPLSYHEDGSIFSTEDIAAIFKELSIPFPDRCKEWYRKNVAHTQ